MAYRKNPPKRWPARDEVRALARQYTVKAMNRLIELMDSKSHFVSVNAARTVLMRGEPEPRQNPRFKRIGRRGVKEVNVKIVRFKEEKQGGKGKRDRKLPVVPRRRQGPRDAGDGDGAGLSAMPGQRPGVRNES